MVCPQSKLDYYKRSLRYKVSQKSFCNTTNLKKNDMTFPYLTCVTNQCLVFVQKFLQFCRQSHGRILVWCHWPDGGGSLGGHGRRLWRGAEYRQLTHSIVVVELVTRSLHHRLSSRRPLHSFGPSMQKPAKNQIHKKFRKIDAIIMIPALVPRIFTSSAFNHKTLKLCRNSKSFQKNHNC